MKKLLLKILSIPLVAYFPTLITVSILGSFFDRAWMKENLDNSALPVWQAWIVLLLIIIIANYIYKRVKNK